MPFTVSQMKEAPCLLAQRPLPARTAPQGPRPSGMPKRPTFMMILRPTAGPTIRQAAPCTGNLPFLLYLATQPGTPWPGP